MTLSSAPPSLLDAREGKRVLQNEDRPGFYVRFYKPFHPVDIKRWRLIVDGLCERPLRLSIEEIRRLPQMTETSRLKCVECWSAKATWTGFKPEALFELARPLKTAKYLYFSCADSYFEYISMEDLLKPGVLFVHTMNSRPLPHEYGAPLRLIIPFKYGYKSVKTITNLTFSESGGEGYWSKFGYPADGVIQPGYDYQLDIGKTVWIEEGGKIEQADK